MKNLNQFFVNLYKNFNDLNIEEVISKMTPTVKWANGMDGVFYHL